MPVWACPDTFHDRKSYNKINKIHEKALRIIHKDSTSNFEGLLIKSNSVPVHQRNLQLLLIEIYKTIINLNPSFMAEANLRGSSNLVLRKARTNLYGIDTVRFVVQKLWQTLPKEIKIPRIGDFQKNIKVIPLHCAANFAKFCYKFGVFTSILLSRFFYSWT